MQLKSTYFTTFMNDRCRDIPSASMNEMIMELTVNAIFVMNTDLEASITVKTTSTISDILQKQKYSIMPFYLVMEAFTKGAMGELGGTTRFTVRNVCTWMNAMYERMAQINAERKTKEDAERRSNAEKIFMGQQKRSNLYGAAFSKKLEWAYSGAINSQDYDRLTLDKIVDALQRGYSIKELQPSMII